MKKTTLVAAAVIFLVGCAGPQRVRYPLDGERRCQGNDLSSVSVSVLPFEDVRRKESKERDELFTRAVNEVHCANIERDYASDSVALDVTRMIARQLEHDWCYSRVYFGGTEAADFYITGKVVDLYGSTASNAPDDPDDYCSAGRSSVLAEIPQAAGSSGGLAQRQGVQFGSMGPGGFQPGPPVMIPTLPPFTPPPKARARFTTRIVYGDVTILSGKKIPIKRFPALVSETSEMIPALANCSEIFAFTHAKLKLANVALAEKISRAIEELAARGGKVPAGQDAAPPGDGGREKTSTIIFYNGDSVKGLVDEVNDGNVVYRKGKYENQIGIMKKNIRAIVTDGDTLFVKP
jgi:hypothetical protein